MPAANATTPTATANHADTENLLLRSAKNPAANSNKPMSNKITQMRCGPKTNAKIASAGKVSNVRRSAGKPADLRVSMLAGFTI